MEHISNNLYDYKQSNIPICMEHISNNLIFEWAWKKHIVWREHDAKQWNYIFVTFCQTQNTSWIYEGQTL